MMWHYQKQNNSKQIDDFFGNWSLSPKKELNKTSVTPHTQS